MYKTLALYLPPEDPEAFREHYETTHVPLVSRVPGLRAFRYSLDVSAPEGESPYFGVSEAEWDSPEALRESLRTPEGQAATADMQSGATGGFVLVVNGSRKLTCCRQTKIDQLGVHSVSVGSVGTRPRSRFRSR